MLRASEAPRRGLGKHFVLELRAAQLKARPPAPPCKFLQLLLSCTVVNFVVKATHGGNTVQTPGSGVLPVGSARRSCHPFECRTWFQVRPARSDQADWVQPARQGKNSCQHRAQARNLTRCWHWVHSTKDGSHPCPAPLVDLGGKINRSTVAGIISVLDQPLGVPIRVRLVVSAGLVAAIFPCRSAACITRSGCCTFVQHEPPINSPPKGHPRVHP